jgi:hypothetical protein
MRRVPLSLLMLLALTTMASAQTATSFNPAQPMNIFGAAAPATVSPDVVVARLMTFDRDGDGRLVQSELPERMQNLIAADVSGDRALDQAEIRALARPVPPVAMAATIPGQRFGGGGGYAFGDQVSLSTRAHVEGALDDLRLPESTQQKALAIVRPFMDRLEADASAALMNELDRLLRPEQVNSIRMAIDRQLSSRTSPLTVVTRPDGSRATFSFRGGPDPALLLTVFNVPAEQMAAAKTAFEGFKERIRPGIAERAALLDELAGVLNDEERENYGAALQRRPLVKAGGFAGIVSGVSPPFQRLVLRPGDVNPAVLRRQVIEQ